MTPYVLELCRGRFGDDPHCRITAPAPDTLMIELRACDGIRAWILNRGDIAMLRGMLANMASNERAMIAAGLMQPLECLDRPAGMDPYFFTAKTQEKGT